MALRILSSKPFLVLWKIKGFAIRFSLNHKTEEGDKL
jgi:hypothetical protein